MLVNDVHSQLNPTLVDRVVAPDSLDALREIIESARSERKALCISGGRHAMGAQQFGTQATLVDMANLKRVLDFNPDRGTIEVEAGIQWPDVVEYLISVQDGLPNQWGIAQKQTGANRLSIGGALAANVHGRGLRMKPIIGDVESFVVMDAAGHLHRCSRQENTELFRLAVGGYGLFGLIYSATLRLMPRQKIQRIVDFINIDELMPAFERRIAEGFIYGDFQYSIDEKSDDFLTRGILSCYRPVDLSTPIPTSQRELSAADWSTLIYLAHVDKAQAYRWYVTHYLATTGQIYWSDTHQLSYYLDDYHRLLDQKLGAPVRATEVITEIYVPRPSLATYMREARDDFRLHGVDVIYGTIRLIERDDESFLAWATQPYACIIFNLHTVHSPVGLERSTQAFRRLIDLAIRHGGSYYLTYHKHATHQQVKACYPQFSEFLRLKRRYDPEERFQSDWYRHYNEMIVNDE